MSTLAGNKHLSIPPHCLRLFIFRRKMYEPNWSEVDIKCSFLHRHNKYYYKQKIKYFPIVGGTNKFFRIMKYYKELTVSCLNKHLVPLRIV